MTADYTNTIVACPPWFPCASYISWLFSQIVVILDYFFPHFEDFWPFPHEAALVRFIWPKAGKSWTFGLRKWIGDEKVWEIRQLRKKWLDIMKNLNKSDRKKNNEKGLEIEKNKEVEVAYFPLAMWASAFRVPQRWPKLARQTRHTTQHYPPLCSVASKPRLCFCSEEQACYSINTWLENKERSIHSARQQMQEAMNDFSEIGNFKLGFTIPQPLNDPPALLD